jgi:hypothetical protein
VFGLAVVRANNRNGPASAAGFTVYGPAFVVQPVIPIDIYSTGLPSPPVDLNRNWPLVQVYVGAVKTKGTQVVTNTVAVAMAEQVPCVTVTVYVVVTLGFAEILCVISPDAQRKVASLGALTVRIVLTPEQTVVLPVIKAEIGVVWLVTVACA